MSLNLAQVWYNKIGAAGLSRASLATASTAGSWQFGAILPDLSYTRAGALQTALFPPSVGGPGAASGIIGVATARLAAGWDNPLAASYQFQVCGAVGGAKYNFSIARWPDAITRVAVICCDRLVKHWTGLD